MGDQGTFATIEHLPTEIMCKIFDHLDIDSVKECSLVCCRWNEIVFSDYYIKRFRLIVAQHSFFRSGLFGKLDRLYRHLTLCLQRTAFNIVYSVLQYPKLKQYITLELVNSAPENLKIITNAIPQMGELRELRIVHRDWQEVDYHISNNSLQLLRLNNTLPTLMCTTNLNTLKLKIVDPSVPIGRLFSYQFPNLKHLEFETNIPWHGKDVANAIRFFSQLEGLETLTVGWTCIYGFILKAICECCSNLEKLHIRNLIILDESVINHLSQLTKLSVLELEKVIALGPVSFLNVKLPQLTTLGIGHFPIQYETLGAFRSATKLKLFDDRNPKEFISTIGRKMPLIREIECMAETNDYFRFLELLPCVEVAVFHKESLDTLAQRLLVVHSLSNIKEIYSKATSTKPTDSTIAILLQGFPKLQLLGYGDNLVHKIV